MVNSDGVTVDSSQHTPLIRLPPHDDGDTVADAVDYKHNPAVRSKTGRWRSAAFIIGVETAELIVDSGVQGNLINFLTGNLRQSVATAAANVNAWAGVASLLPILGAVIADSYLGKYSTVITASLIYISGLAMLTVSAMLTSVNSQVHGTSTNVVFFGALYLVALGQGGFKPCLHAFGADQFDGDDPEERKAKSSFFNWCFLGLSLGALLGTAFLSYVQDNISWAIGFGIPCVIMVIALSVFILRTSSYRFLKVNNDEQSPFLRIGRVFIRAAKNRRHATSVSPPFHGSKQFRFLDKAILMPYTSDDAALTNATSKSEVEEAKALLRLFPIWATSLVFGIIYAQASTFFTKQAFTLNRSIGSNFDIPPASLLSLIAVCIIIFIPIYDCLLVPFARKLTGKPSGISVLQRIGTGLFLSTLCMIIAAVVEKRRLNIALHYGLIDSPNATVPMSIYWLLPQYAISGISDAFTIVGLQEFFYDQVPVELKSVGMALYLSVLGIGSILSSVLVSLVDKLTRGETGNSWLSDNLNKGRLDYFYWLLAALCSVGLVLFSYFSRSYVYSNTKARM